MNRSNMMKGLLGCLMLCSMVDSSGQAGGITPDGVKAVLKKVADYQIRTPLTHPGADWTNGALYAGMAEWAGIAGDDQYYTWLKAVGDKNGWTYNHRADKRARYHADDYCVGQMYVELYRKYGDLRMITPMREYFDSILVNPSTADLAFEFTDTYWATERWSWCDALFMGPTVWAKMASITGNSGYLDFMFQEYKATTDYLHNSEDHLYFRDSRYFSTPEANGARMFWGRGNGWVFAGLPVILRELPEGYQHKQYFETIFRDMGAKILSLQDAQGYWHASLLDPASYPNPEMSATSFFIFGLAWGISNGYFDKATYLPAVLKGWEAMVNSVWPDGKVGWIQPIGENPKNVTREMTEVYGVGAFLMAGTQVYYLVKSEK